MAAKRKPVWSRVALALDLDWETAATFGPQLAEESRRKVTPSAPVRPKGAGWKLIAAMHAHLEDSTGVVWYWERIKSRRVKG